MKARMPANSRRLPGTRNSAKSAAATSATAVQAGGMRGRQQVNGAACCVRAQVAPTFYCVRYAQGAPAFDVEVEAVKAIEVHVR